MKFIVTIAVLIAAVVGVAVVFGATDQRPADTTPVVLHGHVTSKGVQDPPPPVTGTADAGGSGKPVSGTVGGR